MKTIFSSPYNKALSGSFTEQFEVDRAGIYVIEITASAKSWWQNTVAGRSFLSKDSLMVKCDASTVISLSKKKKLRANDLWNGNVLKNNELTVYLVAYLKAEPHTLLFDIHGAPYVKGISIYALENNIIELKKLTPQKRDRIPWLTFLMSESVLLVSLSISARTAKPQSIDDDDLALRIDGVLVQNDDRRAHREWYWCGKILKGVVKTFTREFEVNESPSRIDLVADGTPAIDELMLVAKKGLYFFTEKDIQTYSYRGSKGNEDYNRFDSEILDIVNEWNQTFNDAYSPPEPLHPNLVKAMMYIESRMGYFESSDYPSYPDVMQIADPRNPAIHTLNNDGWVDPKTKKNAKEYEWKKGKIATLDYGGEANGTTHKESIYWGTRWLYHLAQGITYEKTRYWRSWKEVVRLYNGGGNPNYVQQVYDVYERGIDKRKNTIKLWSIGILLILAFLGSGLGVYAYENHGTVWLSFDETKEEGVEYVLTLNEVRGIITWKTPIAVRYGNGKNFYDIAKTDDVTFYEYYLNDDDYPEIVVKGTSEYAVIVYVLQKVRGEWRIIPNTGESGGALNPAPAFRGHDVSFPNIDGKGWREVEESFHIGYSNAQDEIWHTWYRYDPTMQAFVFIEKNKVPVKDENNLFDEIDVDPIIIRKSPNFTW